MLYTHSGDRKAPLNAGRRRVCCRNCGPLATVRPLSHNSSYTRQWAMLTARTAPCLCRMNDFGKAFSNFKSLPDFKISPTKLPSISCPHLVMIDDHTLSAGAGGDFSVWLCPVSHFAAYTKMFCRRRSDGPWRSVKILSQAIVNSYWLHSRTEYYYYHRWASTVLYYCVNQTIKTNIFLKFLK